MKSMKKTMGITLCAAGSIGMATLFSPAPAQSKSKLNDIGTTAIKAGTSKLW